MFYLRFPESTFEFLPESLSKFSEHGTESIIMFYRLFQILEF